MADLSILKGDDAGPWLFKHLLSDGTYADVTGPDYVCKIKCESVERTVTETAQDTNGNNGFLIYLTPTETDGLGVGDYTLAMQMENASLTPPMRREKHITIAIRSDIVSND